MNDINRLPLTQMKLLIRLWNSPDKIGFAEGRAEGGSIKELGKTGFIEPAGRVGRRIRWKLVSGKVSQNDIDTMSGLAKYGSLPAEQEGLIVQLLHEARDVSVFVSENIGSKSFHYFLESFFLTLRQMGYFFTEGTSPLLPYGSGLSQEEKDVLEKITDIRDAIGHRESRKNFLNANIKIIGGMNFKNSDVEIQYGTNKIYLLGEVFSIHRKLRRLFSSVDELAFLSRGYGWTKDEKELQDAETKLKKKLKNPEALLRRT